MQKYIPFFVLAILLSGCAQKTDNGQQYFDQTLTQPLTQTETIQSNAFRDLNSFDEQAKQVLDNSPSMAAKYHDLYEQLSEWALQSGDPADLKRFGVQSAQMRGGDNQGNVLFTGYFSPVIELRHIPDQTYKYPVYGKPSCSAQCPTRAQIYDGALTGKGLELGYAANMIDPFLMEVQGSGFVHFGDDNSMQYFAYAGKNNRSYVSIGRILIERGLVERKAMSLKAIKQWVSENDEETVKELLEQNPSYVFFAPKDDLAVRGSAGIPLLPMAAVAGDRSWLPMGTPILAEVPLLNADGTWSGTHALRLLLVLDTGGAVKQNHLDLYHGMGARAGVQSGHYKHFGRVWKLGLENSVTANPWQLPKGKE
ncbi:murein transglycosylase A [Vibrio ezurae]|uniref:peptidoglycan lytic exotransglycosylase n=1 Tax=Vibrio ezurae NBRC 102218 TaxID=1219080 RepID=U3B505_9VIBR|nr:murein transglycosylase A [Vibrio ezurae]GAD81020.1 putative transglycosylase [Vibrio ezurae NBRC 102218]